MITLEERESIIRDAVAEISGQSISIDELDTVEEVSDVDSLPAYRNTDGTLVRVPINLLSEPIKQAIDSANHAATRASDAATSADTAARAANLAASRATEAADTVADTVRDIENKVNMALGNVSIKVLKEEDYSSIETPDENVLYFCYSEE